MPGTNFAIRASALAHVGFFPEYTITEDYALGFELKAHGYKGQYLLEYLAVGEAPDEIRNVFRQRSRWTKGMQGPAPPQIAAKHRCSRDVAKQLSRFWTARLPAGDPGGCAGKLFVIRGIV